jgi:hypothetical protein
MDVERHQSKVFRGDTGNGRSLLLTRYIQVTLSRLPKGAQESIEQQSKKF